VLLIAIEATSRLVDDEPICRGNGEAPGIVASIFERLERRNNRGANI
jgi:hypothetical protein